MAGGGDAVPARSGADSPMLGAELEIYTAVSSIEDAAELQARAEQLALSPRSYERDVELEALLLKLVELDSARAVRFAGGLDIDVQFIVSMYQAWAAIAPDAALRSLAAMDDDDLVRTIAMGLVDQLDATFASIERLAGLIDAIDRDGFVSKALVRLAETDPSRAIDDALRLDDYELRRQTVLEIATEWARQDPSAALNRVRNFGPDEARLRNTFHVSLVEQWASVDPDRALEYLVGPEGRTLLTLKASSVAEIVAKLAIRRPDQLLAAAESLSGESRLEIRQAALRSIVDRDLQAAIDRIPATPVGSDRTRLIELVAATYAREDPQAALEWAVRNDDVPPHVIRSLFSEVARHDLGLAVNRALENPYYASAIGGWLRPQGGLSALNAAEIRDLADQLVAAGTSLRPAVAELMSTWSKSDPDAAISWLLNSASVVDRSHLRSLAEGFARGDVEVSAQTVDVLPSALRGDWITEVAGVYMQRSPDAGLDWLARYRDEPDYDAWINAAAELSVATQFGQDFGRTAAMLATAREPDELVAYGVAGRWAESDPRAAADWALGLGEAQARSGAVAGTARSWMDQDRPAAERWALTLPNGPMRDRALTQIVSRSIGSEDPINPRVLDAFSSGAARRQALDNTIPELTRVALENPERAETLIETHIDDSALRRRIQAEIDRLENLD